MLSHMLHLCLLHSHNYLLKLPSFRISGIPVINLLYDYLEYRFHLKCYESCPGVYMIQQVLVVLYCQDYNIMIR